MTPRGCASRWRLLLAVGGALASCGSLATTALAQRSVPQFLPGAFSDSVTNVAPGVEWHRLVNAAGPWKVNLVTIDLTRCRCELREARAKDSLVAREKVSEMARRQPEGTDRVLAAINADFFDVKTGENENNQVIDGEWWKGVRVTDSPYDTFDNPHTQFAIGADGRPRMDRYMFDGTVIHAGVAFPLTALNFIPRGTLEAAVLYTGRYGVTPRDTVRKVAEVALRKVGQRGDTSVYVQSGGTAKAGENAVPAGGAVLSAYGPRSTAVGKFADGDTVRVILRAVSNSGLSTLEPRLLLGGWPRILEGGKSVAAAAPWSEGTTSSNAERRHPRSAIGFSRDSSTVYLMTVDGRSEDSGGMTLVELADFLKGQGAWDALNFDGGGSSTLVVKGRVVNAPSDREGERPVGNAILVVARP